jgi:tetratricopeptide (TPR) repeat protein
MASWDIGVNKMPQPKMLHEEYGKAVVAIDTSEFELHRIVKDLSKSLKAYPRNPALNSTYGSALCRIGNYAEGISKLKYATILEPTNELMMQNLIKAHIENDDYDLAFELNQKAGFSTDLYLDGLFNNVTNKTILSLDLQRDFVETVRLISSMTPYGTVHAVDLDYDMEQPIISIDIDIYASVKDVFSLYQGFVKKLVKRSSDKGLKHIITNFRSVI